MPFDTDILGQGIYTPRRAAQLVGSTPQEVIRWTRGSGPSAPLWHAYYQSIEDSTELSFADLIELRVVKAFRRAGISLQAIRYAISFAEDKFGVERPLSTLRFKTDGKEILIDALEKDNEYVSLSKKNPGQKVFSEIVKQSLFDIEYENELAARWRPNNSRSIIIDPERQFGDAILDKYGVSTDQIYADYLNYSDIGYVSNIYEVDKSLIREAIRFEEGLLKQAKRDGEGLI